MTNKNNSHGTITDNNHAALWHGRFVEGPDAAAVEFETSIHVDERMALDDIHGSKAHAAMLAKQGIISEEDVEAIVKGLDGIAAQIDAGKFEFNIEDEDTALYNLYIYEAAKGKDIKDIVGGSAKYHKDSIDGLMLEKDILDSLKENQIYVARVRLIIPDTSQYYMCNHGWSHPIAFTLKKDTNDYKTLLDVTNACFPGDTANLNKKDLNWL